MQRPGQHMRQEISQAPSVFCETVTKAVNVQLDGIHSFVTVARGSSDAAANILAYEFMANLDRPMTSLPPSVFSLGSGVDLHGSAVILISQSGASDDLVRSAKGARSRGAKVIALTNVENSEVEMASDMTVPIGAGEEIAVPATKTVIGSVAAGMALLAGFDPAYSLHCLAASKAFTSLAEGPPNIQDQRLVRALAQSESVFVIGRGAGFGAAQEVALKLKETCALHAEAYSASEVLHGPLQLASKALTALILDTGETATKDSVDLSETRLRESGAQVFRISVDDLGCAGLVPAAAAAALLFACYKIILDTACSLGLDPDAPDLLAKVTRTV